MKKPIKYLLYVIGTLIALCILLAATVYFAPHFSMKMFYKAYFGLGMPFNDVREITNPKDFQYDEDKAYVVIGYQLAEDYTSEYKARSFELRDRKADCFQYDHLELMIPAAGERTKRMALFEVPEGYYQTMGNWAGYSRIELWDGAVIVSDEYGKNEAFRTAGFHISSGEVVYVGDITFHKGDNKQDVVTLAHDYAAAKTAMEAYKLDTTIIHRPLAPSSEYPNMFLCTP